jgi:tRNA nucleotidyltransferase (CCA-adding enzyme)
MAPQQPLIIIDPLAWERSTATRLALNQLVTAGQLAANEDGRPVEWIVPPGRDHAANS